MPDLIALKPFPYNRKGREVGERFEAKPKDARLLVAIRKARFATAEDDKPQQPSDTELTKAITAEIPAPTTAPKRVYRRRDMTSANIETK